MDGSRRSVGDWRGGLSGVVVEAFDREAGMSRKSAALVLGGSEREGAFDGPELGTPDKNAGFHLPASYPACDWLGAIEPETPPDESSGLKTLASVSPGGLCWAKGGAFSQRVRKAMRSAGSWLGGHWRSERLGVPRGTEDQRPGAEAGFHPPARTSGRLIWIFLKRRGGGDGRADRTTAARERGRADNSRRLRSCESLTMPDSRRREDAD
jgi:hypothetical protein